LFFQLDLLEQRALDESRILQEVAAPSGDQLQTLRRYRLQRIQQFRRELETIQALARAIVSQGVHEDVDDPVQLDLNEVYRRELDLYQASPFFKYKVEKHFHFQPGLPPVCGHYLDFSQSLRNLLDNAMEAMEEAPQRRLTLATALEDDRIVLHLGDTGPGVPPEIMPRIFDPFFTTKGNGSGDHTGLGLFMARRLLAPYGGEIRADSIPGETWVTVSLPTK
jgi:signal transduction histidine kinase